MQYDEIVPLQEQHPAWALLRSPDAALMLSLFSDGRPGLEPWGQHPSPVGGGAGNSKSKRTQLG